MKNTLRIALMGLKGINDWHYFPAIARSERCLLVGGVDPSPAARDSFAKKSDAPLYESLDALMAEHNPDAVFVGTPNPFHLANIEEAATRGLHLSVTKPLCNTVEECRRAISACASAKVILQSGHEYRFRPSMAKARQLVSEGAIGRPTLITAHMGHIGGISSLAAEGTWRSKAEFVPGGCMNLLGVHFLDLACAFFGDPVSLSAELRCLLSPSGLPDTTVATLTFSGGEMAVVTSSYASAHRDALVVHGTEANIVADERQVFLQTKRQLEPVGDLPPESSSDVIVRQLCAAVLDGVPPETDGRTGLRSVALLEAAVRSSDLRRPVSLAEFLAS